MVGTTGGVGATNRRRIRALHVNGDYSREYGQDPARADHLNNGARPGGHHGSGGGGGGGYAIAPPPPQQQRGGGAANSSHTSQAPPLIVATVPWNSRHGPGLDASARANGPKAGPMLPPHPDANCNPARLWLEAAHASATALSSPPPPPPMAPPKQNRGGPEEYSYKPQVRDDKTASGAARGWPTGGPPGNNGLPLEKAPVAAELRGRAPAPALPAPPPAPPPPAPVAPAPATAPAPAPIIDAFLGGNPGGGCAAIEAAAEAAMKLRLEQAAKVGGDVAAVTTVTTLKSSWLEGEADDVETSSAIASSGTRSVPSNDRDSVVVQAVEVEVLADEQTSSSPSEAAISATANTGNSHDRRQWRTVKRTEAEVAVGKGGKGATVRWQVSKTVEKIPDTKEDKGKSLLLLLKGSEEKKEVVVESEECKAGGELLQLIMGGDSIVEGGTRTATTTSNNNSNSNTNKVNTNTNNNNNKQEGKCNGDGNGKKEEGGGGGGGTTKGSTRGTGGGSGGGKESSTTAAATTSASNTSANNNSSNSNNSNSNSNSSNNGSSDNSKGAKNKAKEETEIVAVAEGFCETSAGPYPTSLLSIPWEPLVRPIVDFAHPKSFVGIEVFSKKNGGIAVPQPSTKPQVLVDLEDRGLLFMFKPSGWATCSTPHWQGHDGNLIRHVWKSLNLQTAAPCHRLDKGTSGIVVVATNKNASKHICMQISGKTLVKQYIGLCHGRIVPTAGAFSGPLALSPTDKPLGTCSLEGREAVTRFRVLGYFHRHDGYCYSLVQVQIDHGRQHQIRLHMASLGHPLVCDAKYNGSKLREDLEVCPRLFLHACFLRCLLPPNDEGVQEPFSVACRLPAELKHTLQNLRLGKAGEAYGTDGKHLPPVVAEAERLCACLLAPEQRGEQSSAAATNSESVHLSRLVVRRRDEFLNRFGFTSSQKAEVARTLVTLPTVKERLLALANFRVLGQRTPDFIVSRFAKYVEGLLRWRKPSHEDEGEDATSSDSDAAEAAAATAIADAADRGADEEDGIIIDPVKQVEGPVRIHAETVWCEVCGAEERAVSLEVPALALRVRVAVKNKELPQCFRELAEACGEACHEEWEWDEKYDRGWSEAPSSSWVPKHSYSSAAAVTSSSTSEWEGYGGASSSGHKKKHRDREDHHSEWEVSAWHSHSSYRNGWASDRYGYDQGWSKGYDTYEKGSSTANGTSEEEWERYQKEKDLQVIVRRYLREAGGSCEGPTLASEIAPQFNQWIRTNAKRNDGSLRRWIDAIPGITVESCGHNRWRVHLG